MSMKNAVTLAVICLSFAFALSYNEFHLNNGQNSDWLGRQHRYRSDHQIGAHFETEWLQYKMCPPSMDEIGRATWVFMHTVAALNPENPTEEQQIEVGQLLKLVNAYYPYPINHYLAGANNEPDTSSGSSLSQWVCKIHNVVNSNMGKPEFACNNVDERWRDGRCN